jgi:hypothetical protein
VTGGPLSEARALAWGRAKLAGISLAGLVIIFLVIAFAVKSCAPAPRPKIDPKTQKSIDSLDATKPGFEKQKDSLITVVKHDTIFAKAADKASAEANTRAERSRASAVASGKRADSLAAVARAHADSALLWRNAYEQRTMQADTLTRTVAEKDSALTAEHAAFLHEQDARIGLGRLFGADTLRRLAIEKVNKGLEDDIKKLQQPCRIVGPIPCPSRTVVGLLSATLGAVAGRATKH